MTQLTTSIRTELEITRVTPIHVARLQKGFDRFRLWCQRHGDCCAWTPDDPDKVSGILAHYIQALRNDGGSLTLARLSVLGVQFQHRNLQFTLKRAWDSIASWQAAVPTRNRTPLPFVLMQGMVLYLATTALTTSSPFGVLYWSAAVLIRIGLHGLFRPMELLKLTTADVSLPLTDTDGPVIIALREPKNRRFGGRNQFRTVHDPGTSAWLRWWLHGLAPGQKLWPAGPRAFRQIWDMALRHLDASHCGLTPASMRAGGATHLYLTGLQIASLRFRGGWTSDKGLAVYVQEAMATLVWRSLNAERLAAIAAAVAQDHLLLETAPKRPWRSIFLTQPTSRLRTSLLHLGMPETQCRSSAPSHARAAPLSS